MSVVVDQGSVGSTTTAKVASAAMPGSFPARGCPPVWPATGQSSQDLLARLTSPPFVVGQADKQAKRANGLKRLVGWLADQPGRTWEERWVSSGADAAGAGWRQVPTEWLAAGGDHSAWRRDALIEALPVLVSADAIRPSLRWLVGGGPAHGGLFVRTFAASRDPEGFARLAAAADAAGGVSTVARGQ